MYSEAVYSNPIPVIVVLYKATIFADITGILIEKRNIEPCKNGWALPGGYIDCGESYQEAASRELYEEIGIVTDPINFKLVDVITAKNNNIVIFCEHVGDLKHFSEIHFVDNSEVQSIKFICNSSTQDLCFSTHNQMLEKYLQMK